MSKPPTARTVEEGSTGAYVRWWQSLLRGIDATLAVSGQFDSRTRQATEEFQRRVSLPPDGIVDAPTRRAMDDLLVWLAALPEPRPTMSYGDRGDQARYAQRRLNTHGAAVAVDGVFGGRMVSAVKGFQRRNGLVADGVIGPATWARLG